MTNEVLSVFESENFYVTNTNFVFIHIGFADHLLGEYLKRTASCQIASSGVEPARL